MAQEKGRVDEYLETIKRIEPNIAMIDQNAAAASISVSLKRIADAQEHQAISLKRIADEFCAPLRSQKGN